MLLDWVQIGSCLACTSFQELFGGEYEGFVGHPEAATMFWNFDLLQVRLIFPSYPWSGLVEFGSIQS